MSHREPIGWSFLIECRQRCRNAGFDFVSPIQPISPEENFSDTLMFFGLFQHDRDVHSLNLAKFVFGGLEVIEQGLESVRPHPGRPHVRFRHRKSCATNQQWDGSCRRFLKEHADADASVCGEVNRLLRDQGRRAGSVQTCVSTPSIASVLETVGGIIKSGGIIIDHPFEGNAGLIFRVGLGSGGIHP